MQRRGIHLLLRGLLLLLRRFRCFRDCFFFHRGGVFEVKVLRQTPGRGKHERYPRVLALLHHAVPRLDPEPFALRGRHRPQRVGGSLLGVALHEELHQRHLPRQGRRHLGVRGRVGCALGCLGGGLLLFGKTELFLRRCSLLLQLLGRLRRSLRTCAGHLLDLVRVPRPAQPGRPRPVSLSPRQALYLRRRILLPLRVGSRRSGGGGGGGGFLRVIKPNLRRAGSVSLPPRQALDLEGGFFFLAGSHLGPRHLLRNRSLSARRHHARCRNFLSRSRTASRGLGGLDLAGKGFLGLHARNRRLCLRRCLSCCFRRLFRLSCTTSPRSGELLSLQSGDGFLFLRLHLCCERCKLSCNALCLLSFTRGRVSFCNQGRLHCLASFLQRRHVAGRFCLHPCGLSSSSSSSNLGCLCRLCNRLLLVSGLLVVACLVLLVRFRRAFCTLAIRPLVRGQHRSLRPDVLLWSVRRRVEVERQAKACLQQGLKSFLGLLLQAKVVHLEFGQQARGAERRGPARLVVHAQLRVGRGLVVTVLVVPVMAGTLLVFVLVVPCLLFPLRLGLSEEHGSRGLAVVGVVVPSSDHTDAVFGHNVFDGMMRPRVRGSGAVIVRIALLRPSQ
mmetsp:Transcript_31702/g.72813  ORF Transcript_31702/g.72813 Transcript_31702/m.72813 type:complete len:614 (-) Transcript_31702:80-1921(-)